MGSSSCSNLFCNYEKNIELTTPFNQPTNNNQSQKNIKNDSNNSIQNELLEETKYNTHKQLIPKLKCNIKDFCNKEDIKILINNFNIREISFPVDKNKLGEESARLYEKIERVLNKFYPCNEKELDDIELYLVKIFIKIKSNLYKNIKENKVILCGKLNKLINFDKNIYSTKKQSERFCVLYNDVFKYYRSEIQFLKGLKPLNILYLNQISRINLVKQDINSKKLNYIIICNKYSMEKEEKNYKNFGRDIYDNLYINHSNESIIIFTNNDENNIYKWFAYMNFLIYLKKER